MLNVIADVNVKLSIVDITIDSNEIVKIIFKKGFKTKSDNIKYGLEINSSVLMIAEAYKPTVIVKKSKNRKLQLHKVKLHAHKKHNFNNKLMKNKKINYIRINIYPDGGISRIRVLGRAE